ncbi:hypothetical protein TrST_g14171 [Triparma strigata]|uniref:Uncharacterized protein n=1 Tax=Triparma strigata TaxID=1606541 RepID=A0A9W7A0Z8_9STRA|nr:hypothetical protein TrST_g14171 [Triparma strigata]
MTAIVTAARGLNIFVGLEHCFFMSLETIFWRTKARSVFRTRSADLNATAGMAAQQGIYNLFLAVGAILSAAIVDHRGLVVYPMFMLWAACFGATSILPKIFLFQGMPALVTVAVALLAFPTKGEALNLTILGVVGAAVLAVGGAYWKKVDEEAKGAAEPMVNN